MDKLIISSYEYRHYVELGIEVNNMAADIRDKDQKKKFLMRGYPPTVEQLEAHDAYKNLEKYLPYFVYYHEPDLSGFLFDSPEIRATRNYLNKLFKERLSIDSIEREEPYLVDSDLYDEMVENNRKYCQTHLKDLTKEEAMVLYPKNDITLERIESLDIAANIDRFLPFVLRMAEPKLSTIPGRDRYLIRKYLMDVLVDAIEFKED